MRPPWVSHGFRSLVQTDIIELQQVFPIAFQLQINLIQKENMVFLACVNGFPQNLEFLNILLRNRVELQYPLPQLLLLPDGNLDIGDFNLHNVEEFYCCVML